MITPLLISQTKKRQELRAEAFRLPKLHLNPRQLCDLELLLNGGFTPLQGFMNENEYDSVVSTLKMPDGTIWPIPIVLDVPDIKGIKIGSNITLCDEYGKPLAIFTVESIYKPNKEKEAREVYRTTHSDHFGVRYLFHQTGQYYLGGKIKGFDTVDRFDFIEYRLTPTELRSFFEKNKWERVVGFQTRNPIHRAHFFPY